MSKTYRRSMLRLDCNCGAPIYAKLSWNKNGMVESIQASLEWANSRGVPVERTCECEWVYDHYTKRNTKRDRKNPWKPGKVLKHISKRHFRAKVKHCMEQEKYECMPVIKKTDVWDYN